MSQTAHSMQCNVLVCITTTAGSVMATSNLKPTNYEFKVAIKSLQESGCELRLQLGYVNCKNNI